MLRDTNDNVCEKQNCTPLKMPIEINRFRSSFTYNDVRASLLNYVYTYIAVYLKEWILLFSGRKSKPNGVSYTIFLRTGIHKETIFSRRSQEWEIRNYLFASNVVLKRTCISRILLCRALMYEILFVIHYVHSNWLNHLRENDNFKVIDTAVVVIRL